MLNPPCLQAGLPSAHAQIFQRARRFRPNSEPPQPQQACSSPARSALHGGLDLSHDGLYFGQYAPSMGISSGKNLKSIPTSVLNNPSTKLSATKSG
jgi:hypothetical protein